MGQDNGNSKHFHKPLIKTSGPYAQSELTGLHGGKYLGRVHRIEITCPRTVRAPVVWPEHQSTWLNSAHVVYADDNGDILDIPGGVASDDFTIVDVLVEGVALRTGNYGDAGELGFYFEHMGENQFAYCELAQDEYGQLWLIVSAEDCDPQD